MAAILGAIQAATSVVLGTGDLSIDNWTFKLFYRWSVTLLVSSSVLVSCNQLFGDPIHCDMPGEGVDEKVLKSYCWMYSTFNIPRNFEGNCARKSSYSGDHPIYNTYYQWVAVFLIFQAILFYVPRVIWLMMEGGLMKFLGKGTTGRIIEDSDEKRDKLVILFKVNLKNKYNKYAFIFFSCELLNLVVATSQFFITDAFLQHQFLFYGPKVISFYQLPSEEAQSRDVNNPMCDAFPRVASCTYFRYGMGGAQIQLQALCILSLNIIIDKIYLVLWFWYVLLAFFGSVRVISRTVQVSSSYVRYWLLKIKVRRFFKADHNSEAIKEYVIKCKIGDWFVLYQMSKNLNRRFFYDFVLQLSKDAYDEESKPLAERLPVFWMHEVPEKGSNKN